MPVLTAPYQNTSPEVLGINPQSRFSSVLFPQPDGPTMLTISPGPSVRVISEITSLAASVSSSKIFLRLDTTSGGFVPSTTGRFDIDRFALNRAGPKCAGVAIIEVL